MKKSISLNRKELVELISESVKHILSEGTLTSRSIYKSAVQFIKDVYNQTRQTASQIQRQYKDNIMSRRTFVFDEKNPNSIPPRFLCSLAQMRDNAAKGLLKVGINNDGTFTIFLLRTELPFNRSGVASAEW